MSSTRTTAVLSVTMNSQTENAHVTLKIALFNNKAKQQKTHTLTIVSTMLSLSHE